MLAPYSKIPACKVQKKEKEEEDIINGFYEERKSRSNNQKFHNLLKKNISFFQKEPNRGENPHHQSFKDEEESFRETTPLYRRLSQPPLPPTHGQTSTVSVQPPKQSRSNSDLLTWIQPSPQSPPEFPSLNSTKNSDENYRQKLKTQLNRRININQYLSKLQQFDKENTEAHENKHEEEEISLKKMPVGYELNKMVLKCGDKYNEPENSLVQNQNSDFLDQYSRISHKFSRMSNGNPVNQSVQINDSRHQTANNLNLFEVTKNNRDTDRSLNARHTFGSAQSSRRQSLRSEESPASNCHKLLQISKKSEYAGVNCLTGQELSELHENSHPLRDSRPKNPNKPKLPTHATQMSPQRQANYKRKVRDLQLQLQQLRQKHKKQDKFIQSIQKMRKVMSGDDEDCSLKQLWRWIKQLPRK